jgi:hypothetical protein
MRKFTALTLLASLTACVTPPPPKDYTAFNAQDPHSILVIPAVNNSTEVKATNDYLTTLPEPLAERGYYVFPTNMVQHIMQDNGLGDPGMVAQADPVRLAGLFGADAVLYSKIEQWSAQYLVLTANVTVQVHYTLKSGKTGQVLWDQDATYVYSPQAANGGGIGGLIADAVQAAITRGAPNYIPVAQTANALAFTPPNQGLPFGPYDAKHGGF